MSGSGITGLVRLDEVRGVSRGEESCWERSKCIAEQAEEGKRQRDEAQANV